MIYIGIIAEYNPFHNGHIYQIENIKKKFPDSNIIVIMSPQFVQRGEPSILDKFIRADLAVENGVDLVIELPTIYALQSAENFAYGAVKILNSLNIIDYLSFGTETEDINELIKYIDIQTAESKLYNKYLSEFLKKGHNYNTSINLSMEKLYKYLGESYNSDIIKSNNILALEYLRSLNKLKSNIKPFPIYRSKSNHSDTNITSDTINSATSIRNSFSNNDMSFKNSIPNNTYKELIKSKKNNSLNSFYNYFKYEVLINNSNMSDITGYESGMDNLLKKHILNSKNMDDFLKNTRSRRYSKKRIQRFICNYLLKINQSLINDIINEENKYIRVLAFNKNGQQILSKIKNSDLSIVTNLKQIKGIDSISKSLFDIDIKASNLYYFNQNIYNYDYYEKPKIKR